MNSFLLLQVINKYKELHNFKNHDEPLIINVARAQESMPDLVQMDNLKPLDIWLGEWRAHS